MSKYTRCVGALQAPAPGVVHGCVTLFLWSAAWMMIKHTLSLMHSCIIWGFWGYHVPAGGAEGVGCLTVPVLWGSFITSSDLLRLPCSGAADNGTSVVRSVSCLTDARHVLVIQWYNGISTSLSLKTKQKPSYPKSPSTPTLKESVLQRGSLGNPSVLQFIL